VNPLVVFLTEVIPCPDYKSYKSIMLACKGCREKVKALGTVKLFTVEGCVGWQGVLVGRASCRARDPS
jgi:hypothetical protein